MIETGAGGVERFGRVVEEQLSVCRRLEELCAAQSEMVEAGNGEGLLRVLGEREGLVERLRGLTEDAAALRRGVAPEAIGERTREKLDELAAMLERIGRSDERDQAAMERKRDEAATELATIGRRRGALSSYSRGTTKRGGGVDPRFQDREA